MIMNRTDELMAENEGRLKAKYDLMSPLERNIYDDMSQHIPDINNVVCIYLFKNNLTLNNLSQSDILMLNSRRHELEQPLSEKLKLIMVGDLKLEESGK